MTGADVRFFELILSSPKYFAIFIAIWALLVVAGFVVLIRYSQTPGENEVPPQLDEVELPVSVSDANHTLIMAIHPQCPCTRASASELASILRFCKDDLDCVVLAFEPESSTGDWRQADLIRSFKALPKTKVVYDRGGQLARKFGAATSGTVLLYSPGSGLVFHGGITSSRNHLGDNLGSASIRAIVRGKKPLRRETKAYGCPIYSLEETGLVCNESECEDAQL